MPVNTARSKLHVEGADDKHSIANLVKAYGIDHVNNLVVPDIKEIGSIEGLLEGMETAVQLSGGRKIGFVLDADMLITSRWESVRNRLLRSGVDNVPEEPPAEGYIGFSTRFKATVGVWLMPDNTHNGDLECFLETLIHSHDDIIEHARSSTDIAYELGARFAAKDRLKAVIHAWLAWQSKPGLPYGTAITAKYFCHDSEAARKFVEWYVKLFDITTAAA
jgi:hypothetical protein